MVRRIVALCVVMAARFLTSRGQADAQEPKPADRDWIVGTWRSHKLDYGDFLEWQRAKQIELVARSPRDIDLFLISAEGKRSRAGDSQPCLMDNKKLFFGPVGSGLWSITDTPVMLR